MDHKGPGAIQAYQLVFPLSGIGSSLTKNLEVSVPDATVTHSLNKWSHVVYWVSVSSGFADWRIPRSLMEFETLYNALQLVEGVDSACVPQFPGGYFSDCSSGSMMDPAVVKQYRENLNVYLKAVCVQDAMWKCRELVEFLDIQTSMLSIHASVLRMEGGGGSQQQQYVSSPLIWKDDQLRKMTHPSLLAKERH